MNENTILWTTYAKLLKIYTVQEKKLTYNTRNIMSLATPSSSGTKKRELSSPEFTVDIKKNRVYSGSQSESDISDLSVTEEDTMTTQMETTDAAGEVAGSEATLLTLQETHLKQLASLMEKSFQPQISQIIKDSFQTQISELVTSIVNGVLEGLYNKLSSLETENKKLMSENSELKARVMKLEDAVDTAEQYSRRNCLRISGVREQPNENTDDIVTNIASAIDVDIDFRDLDRSHRLGRASTQDRPRDKPRDIIVKFTTYRARARFFKARTLTKSRGFMGVFINEDLTKNRSKLLYEARRRVKSHQLKSAWSVDGTVLIKTSTPSGDDVVRRVTSISDLPVYIAPERAALT
ncbi:MAG: hypothetical protein AB2693_27025 [Candidatus Thiodiazotropha sp.]